MAKSTSTVTPNDLPSPPIFNLDDDILLYIFFLNTDMDQETEEETPALFTLRDTSQVCAGWRALAIGAPSLWARVLNLRFLVRKRETWRDEVVRRTGSAALHIKGRDNPGEPWWIEPFHSWVVDENWDRIRKLDLRFGEDVLVPPGEACRWSSVLRRPTPSLEVFKFSWPAHFDELSASDFTLFSNRAPTLRTLSVHGVRLNLTTLSIPRIRHLVLNSPVVASGFLNALKKMPLLEILEARTKGCFILDQNADESLPLVTLPRLTEITFFGTNWMDPSLPLLAHIIPANSCVLSFYSAYVHEGPNTFSLDHFCDVLSTGRMGLRRAITFESFLSTDNIPFFIYIPSIHQIFFSMERFIANFPGYDICSLFTSVNHLRLDKITELRLRFGDAEGLLSNGNDVKFVSALIFVKVLETDCETLHVLTVTQSNMKAVILPALKIIRLDGIDDQAHVSFIRNFLDSRTELGMPVGAITLKAPANQVKDDILEEVRVLRVEMYS